MAFEGETFIKKTLCETYFMTVEEIWMCRVDIAGLHGDHIGYKLRCRCHGRLKEIDDDAIKTFTQRRIPTECLLTHEKRFRGRRAYYNQRTHYFREKLTKNADKFIVYELAAFEPRIFKSLDLLLHNDFEGRRPNEEGRGRTLNSYISTRRKRAGFSY